LTWFKHETQSWQFSTTQVSTNSKTILNSWELLDTFKTKVLTVRSCIESVSHLLLCPKVSIFDKVLINSLNLSSFKTQVSTVLNVLKFSIFNMVPIESLYLNSFKKQVSTVDKLLTVEKFLTVSNLSLNSLDTLKPQFLTFSCSKVLILTVSKTQESTVKKFLAVKKLLIVSKASLDSPIFLKSQFFTRSWSLGSLNLKSFKTQILTVEKLLTIAKPNLDSFKTQVSTVLITLSLKSWHGLNPESRQSWQFHNPNLSSQEIFDSFKTSQRCWYPKVTILSLDL